ncbi:MAG: pyruvate dehydrogenase (acetyl-transferring), homodimeric type, partial [Betaproteobacteria bacterium]|nr:pyruvate dehydrogenase (acetyl-transferring), homodimeric type [Betaproteobacteria bacterium]
LRLRRTFGMASLFRQVGIYSSMGQRYEPEDIGSVLHYREALDGQILEEGISEAGAMASWTAAATSYAVNGLAMLPFYIYYSVFGFQRVGDQIWAAADQRARGFLIGATSGRTTLAGEGLQHQDGSSPLVAATIPNCEAYDPAFAQELAVIVHAGMHEMLALERDVFYYITLTNESLPQRAISDSEGVLRGMHRIASIGPAQPLASTADVRLLASGAMVHQALQAAQWLAEQGFSVDVFSVTSWSRLAREAMRAERLERIAAEDALAGTWLTKQLGTSKAPIVAVSDYMRAVPEQIRAYLPDAQAMTCLGTDGFGRSDTRSELRDFFEVSARWIAQAALVRLERRDLIADLFDAGTDLNARRTPPWER